MNRRQALERKPGQRFRDSLRQTPRGFLQQAGAVKNCSGGTPSRAREVIIALRVASFFSFLRAARSGAMAGAVPSRAEPSGLRAKSQFPPRRQFGSQGFIRAGLQPAPPPAVLPARAPPSCFFSSRSRAARKARAFSPSARQRIRAAQARSPLLPRAAFSRKNGRASGCASASSSPACARTRWLRLRASSNSFPRNAAGGAWHFFIRFKAWSCCLKSD